jgi:hypothetical protein
MKFSLVIAMSLLVLPAVWVDAGASPAMPNQLHSVVSEALPVWVSAEEAIDAEGNLVASKVGEHSVLMLRDLNTMRQRRGSDRAALSTDGCAGYLALPTPEHYRRNATFRDLTTEASAVLNGRVVARDEGFFRGIPASLVRISVSTVFRQSPDFTTPSQDVYLIYPYANLRVNGSMHCTRARLPFEPMAGDRVLIFKYLPSASPDAIVIEADANREVVFENKGRLILPPTLLNDPDVASVRTFDALSTLVAKTLASNGRGGRAR